ncbi:MAG: ADP-forming succinate--CoA ligase subunit beta [Demequinaceae bacterium]|nr:ADP-forming succinate--CoA ligase subunit beta [Demequinaceae bacterium]
MDLYEYQARDLFERHGVPVLPGIVAETPSEARAAAERMGGDVVVKAQVKTNGRGKAGGIKRVASPAEAEAEAARILGMTVKGNVVKRVMVTPAAAIAEEYYFSLLLDRSTRRYLALCSVEGGMDIERLAAEHPGSLARIDIDPRVGINEAKAREIVTAARIDPEIAPAVAEAVLLLGRVYTEEEAILVEVNPLVRTEAGDVIALDGKVTLDDNARFRHPDHLDLLDPASSDPLELRAADKHLNYVKLDGQVGIIGNGAGLVMSTLDGVADAGKTRRIRPANFLDIGGGASAEVMASGLDIILADPQVRAVFVNVFGGITSCVEVARGIVGALEAMGDAASRPIVVRLDGNAVADGRRILAEAGHPLVTQVDTMDEAAARVAELAAEAS